MRRQRVGVVAALVVGAALVSGCAGSQDGSSDARQRREAESAGQRPESGSAAPAESKAPQTPGEFLALTRKAMDAEKGWRFRVSGTESLQLTGQPANGATYSADGRWTSAPRVLHTGGAIRSGDKELAVESYVVGEMGHFREDKGPWEKGPVSEPENAAKVEDPMAAVASFESYAGDPGGAAPVRIVKRGDEIRLQVRIDTGSLGGRERVAAIDKAGREFDPTLAQLKERGVAVPADDVVLRDLQEELVLDARTWQVKSHRLAFAFAVPYQGRQITYKQEVRQDVSGAFDGVIQLPAGVH